MCVNIYLFNGEFVQVSLLVSLWECACLFQSKLAIVCMCLCLCQLAFIYIFINIYTYL